MAPASHSAADHNPSPTAEVLVGWVLESSGRGSLGLIVTCLFTIFLCTWVVIHARVYRRPSHRLLHKMALFIKAIIAPEFIAVEGLQEWSQSQRMVKDCAELTGGRLKLIHAYYISMLALRYRTPHGSRVIWPNQFTWMLQQGLVKWDDHAQWGLAEENIRDKSNADGATKLLALAQVSWFAAQSVMRSVHKLPLAQLESMTLSYIPLFAITYLFWWVKPKDVKTPSVVDLPDMLPEQKAIFDSMAVSNNFDDEGLKKQESLWTIWALTPRVFEKEAADKEFLEAQQRRDMAFHDLRPILVRQNEFGVRLKGRSSAVMVHDGKDVQKETVVANWDPELYHSKTLWPITCLFGASFGALHLIAWYTQFPTSTERWLWRGAALASIASMLVFMQFKRVVVRWGGPLTLISLVSPVVYLLSRVVMIGGVIAAFRASDPAIYDTYVVSTYWVHFL
ncbi:MAG: hypothetical protein Q9191_001881 [Dirinaria sp. TL-2023a]